ncbi:MAG: S4 domain-containing protein [Angelakisella sp.]
MKPELIRLDKALADQGTVTRSQARELITKGLVTVNGLTLPPSCAGKLTRWWSTASRWHCKSIATCC